jgi:hypothetical protein
MFMPVRFGDVAAFASFSTLLKAGRRRMSDKAREDWLVRQPGLLRRGRFQRKRSPQKDRWQSQPPCS